MNRIEIPMISAAIAMPIISITLGLLFGVNWGALVGLAILITVAILLHSYFSIK